MARKKRDGNNMVLLDIVCGTDGLETLEKIKKNESLKNFPILFLQYYQ
jgi:CheY-like chemotaxis protein